MKSDAEAIADLFEKVSLGAPEKAVGFVMWRVMHRYVREIDRCLKPLDLTHLQFTALALAAWMARTGEASTQSELARFSDIHPMQVSTVPRALEHKRMILRTPAADNALAKRVSITASGLDTLRDALPLVVDVQERLFGPEGRAGGSLLSLLLRISRKTAAE